jgi:hypothetical protein
MPASQSANFNLQEFSDAGLLLLGGRLYTYGYGTTAQKTAYTDPAGTVPHTYTADGAGGQYIALNARGELPAPLYLATGSYDLTLKRGDGSTIWTRKADGVDNTPNSLAAALAAATGALLVGFIQAGVGAVFRWIRDKLRETVSPEDFGAVGDGVADDSAAWMAATNSFPTATGGTLRLTSGKTYKILTAVSTNNRNLVIEGNNAILLVGANMTYGLSVISTNCEVRNLQINRAAGVVVTAGVYMTGLQHVLRNVTSRDQKWPIFILAQDLKESHFSEIRVDNDVTGKTGIIMWLDYCVNNTMSDSMLGFCAQMIYGSSTAQPVSGYHTEGLLLSNVIGVYAGKAVNIDNGTFIAICNCIFDFIELSGVFVSNGNTLNISNCWIASNLTNNFIGVGSLAAVPNVTVIGTAFVRGAAAITGTSALSLTGPNAIAMGNSFQSGMNGGTVTQATSQVLNNTSSGGGADIIATNTISAVRGSLVVVGSTTSDKFQTGTAAVAGVANGVVTTVYALPNAAPAMYLVTCNIGTVADVNNFTAFAIIGADATTAKIMMQTNGTLLAVTLSGLNIQVNQTSGSARTVNTTVTKIG